MHEAAAAAAAVSEGALGVLTAALSACVQMAGLAVALGVLIPALAADLPTAAVPVDAPFETLPVGELMAVLPVSMLTDAEWVDRCLVGFAVTPAPGLPQAC